MTLSGLLGRDGVFLETDRSGSDFVGLMEGGWLGNGTNLRETSGDERRLLLLKLLLGVLGCHGDSVSGGEEAGGGEYANEWKEALLRGDFREVCMSTGLVGDRDK